jgi:CheY-like chemotaxis protein
MARILVIEDNADIRENTAELLELKGHSVISAESGHCGLEEVRNSSPDLILCDIQMPEMNGYEVLRQIQADTLTAKIPFVFLTANAEKREMMAAMELGIAGYIRKPFEPHELYAIIQKCLSTAH